MPVVSHHEVYTPRGLDDALRFLAEHADEGWQPIAGDSAFTPGLFNTGDGNNQLSDLPGALEHDDQAS